MGKGGNTLGKKHCLILHCNNGNISITWNENINSLECVYSEPYLKENSTQPNGQK